MARKPLWFWVTLDEQVECETCHQKLPAGTSCWQRVKNIFGLNFKFHVCRECEYTLGGASRGERVGLQLTLL